MPRDGDPCERIADLVSGRAFVFVGGPFGPFTRTLGAELRRAGARCMRVILNGGDFYDWGPENAAAYFGPRDRFGDWFVELINREGVTDVIVYGDANPYCAAAKEEAGARQLSIHVLEQGYFRPFWITLERGGVNGNSRLPRDPRAYRDAAAGLPSPEDRWLPPLTPPAVVNLAAYHFVLWLATPLFPRFHLPYDYSLPRQAIGHVRGYLSQKLFRARRRRVLARATEGEGPLFVGILQRPGDSQLRLHSGFATTAAFIERTVRSFARHAAGDARLLFKSHPLDHGIEPHGAAAARSARAHGVRDRVFFTDVGDLQDILARARGAITVNSTAGLAAIQMGCPTIALGVAIYDMPGLTHQDGLDTFWSAPTAPDPTLCDAFRRVVIQRCQVSGAYAIREGIERAVPEVARRLLTTAPPPPRRRLEGRPLAEVAARR